MSLSTSYRDETLACVVQDQRREDFHSRETIQEKKGLRLGILSGQYYTAKLREALPQAEWVELLSPCHTPAPLRYPRVARRCPCAGGRGLNLPL
jgi:hypothetical protein